MNHDSRILVVSFSRVSFKYFSKYFEFLCSHAEMSFHGLFYYVILETKPQVLFC